MILPLLAALALAADLDGTWTYDRETSDDLGPLLEARGVPWHLRATLGSLDRTLVLRVEGSVLHAETRTAVRDSADDLPLDGVPRDQTTPRGDVARVHHVRVGEEVVTVARLALADGSPATLTTRRAVGQDGRLRVTTTLVADSGRSWAATEVYRRAEAP